MIRENVALAPLTYYKIGGPARYFAQPQNTDELAQAASFIRANGLRYFVLGAGSNVLVSDKGFDGLVISTAKLERGLACEKNRITAGTSVMVIQLLRLCMSEGIGGFEFLVGIPGNIGGVLYMNAGTKLGEASGTVLELTAYDLATGASRVVPRAQMQYSYRAQHFLGPHEIILRGAFEGQSQDPKLVQDEIQRLLTARKKSQPIDKPSCGSVFKNPSPQTDVHAWKLIANAGLRGHRIGAAQISELHTNFIVNLGGAKAADVKALIEEAKARVFAQCGVRLVEEVRMIECDGGKELS